MPISPIAYISTAHLSPVPMSMRKVPRKVDVPISVPFRNIASGPSADTIRMYRV